MSPVGKVTVEDIECRLVAVEDIIEPEDFNCRADILSLLVSKANQLSMKMEDPPESLLDTLAKLAYISGGLRRVGYGDYVLAEDVNQLVDALLLFDSFNNDALNYYVANGYTLPEGTDSLVIDFTNKVKKIFIVHVGDILEPEPWNSIAELLAEEYEILKRFEQASPGGVVSSFVTHWLYERYKYTYLYKDRARYLEGNLMQYILAEDPPSTAIIFEKFRQIAGGCNRLRILGLDLGGVPAYVFREYIYVLEGISENIIYRHVFSSEDYIGFIVDGVLRMYRYYPTDRREAVSTGQNLNIIYFASRNEQALIALDVNTGEELWRTSIWYMEAYESPLVVDDVDLDGVPEVVVFTYRLYNTNARNKLMIINGETGEVEALWAYPEFDTYWAGYGMGDIDGDNRPEYAIGDWEARLTILDHDGTILRQILDAVPKRGFGHTGLSLGDIDRDGVVEVLYTSWDNSTIACFNPLTGTKKWQYAANGGYADKFFPPFLADVDGDGKLEALAWLDYLTNSDAAGLYLIDDDGSLIWFLNFWFGGWYNVHVGDADGDGLAEAVVAGEGALFVLIN